MNHSAEALMLQGFLLCLCQLGTTVVAWFVARVTQRRHQTKTQQDGWHLLLAYWPLIGNNKQSLNTISLWLTDSNRPPTARHRRMHTHTGCANKPGNAEHVKTQLVVPQFNLTTRCLYLRWYTQFILQIRALTEVKRGHKLLIGFLDLIIPSDSLSQ